jgi:uncharacterized membrane protein
VTPARAFVWVALVFGIPLAAITAPFQAPDEPQHFLRAFQVSEGGLLPVHVGPRGGGVLPLSLTNVADQFQHLRFHSERKTSWQEIRQAMRVPLDPQKRTFIPFVSAIYSPIAYLPQAAGIAIVRPFAPRPLALMYAARWANLLAWAAMGYLALRVAPVCARPLFLLLLVPMSLFEAASMSADATTDALAVLFAATVMRMALADDGRVVSGAGWAGLTLLSAAFTLTKFAYAPVCAMALLIPTRRFGSRKRRAAAFGLFFAANVAVILLWAPQTGGLDAVLREDGGVSARRQIAYLRGNPGAVIHVAAKEFSADAWRMVRSFVGSRLGSKDVKLPGGLIDVYLACLLLACWSEQDTPDRPPLRKLLIWVLVPAGISIALIGLLNFLYWTPVGANRIQGMQGRYLIPLAPGVLLVIWAVGRQLPKPPWHWASPQTLDAVATLVAVTGAVCTLLAVYFRYYVS